MNNQISQQQLQQKLEQLPREMSPERDLWPGIEQALQRQPQTANRTRPRTRALPVAWAASLVAAVLLTWVGLSPQQQNLQGELSLVATMKNNFKQQKQTMLVSFGQPELTKLPKAMQQQLTQLASAREAIQVALAADANNVDLVNLLRWTQQQELALLEQLYSPKWQSI